MAPHYSRQEKAKWVANPSQTRQRSPVRIPECDNQDLIKKNELTLVGRVTNPRIQNAKALVNYMLQFWNLEGRISGRDLGPEKFQFSFKTEEDLQLVLSWSPFHFKHWMFILQRWEPIISEAFPSNILFWIQLHGVPQHYWTVAALKSIGAAVGEVEAVDTDAARIRVHINALQPIEKSVPILLPSGETTKVDLEYERLEKHCFLCFSLAHEQKDCMERSSRASRDNYSPDSNQKNTLHRLEEGKKRQASKKEDARVPKLRYGRSEVSPQRHYARPQRRRSPLPRNSQFKGQRRDYSPRRDRDNSRRFERRESRQPIWSSYAATAHGCTHSQNYDYYSASKRTGTEDRRRGSPHPTRSFQATNNSPARGQDSVHRGSLSQREEILNTPPPPAGKPPQHPPLRESEQEVQTQAKSRRPALERLSGGDNPAAGLPAPRISSSLSGRLQDVNIHYLGDEDQATNLQYSSRHLGSSSAPSHPTLGHRLSLGLGDNLDENRTHVSLRIEPAQPEIVVTIPAKPPRKKAVSKRKTTAGTSRPNGLKSPLQGANTRKRNVSRPKAMTARKRLCPEVLPNDQDQGNEAQGEPSVVVQKPVARKTKDKVDFQDPLSPLP